MNISFNKGRCDLTVGQSSTVNNVNSILCLREKVSRGVMRDFEAKKIVKYPKILHFEMMAKVLLEISIPSKSSSVMIMSST